MAKTKKMRLPVPSAASKLERRGLAGSRIDVPAAIAALARISVEIKNATSLEDVQALADIAAGLQRRWRAIKELADGAGVCWVEAEAKIGEELSKVKAKPFQGRAGPGRGKKLATNVEASFSDAPTLKDMEISFRQSARVNKLYELASELDELIGELQADLKPVSPNTVLALHRQRNKVEKKHKLAASAFSADGPFDCVVIDPPWEMQKIDREERPNQDAFDYPVMSEEQLATFWPGEIASKLSDDCHVFCWTTQKHLPMALRLLDVWSLKYVLVMVWHKPGGFQPVGLPQYNCEFIVYARKGSPQFIDTKDFFCCFEAPRREHSRKPDLFYDTVKRVTGGSRIDVFSREKRDGFAQYGNENAKFNEAAE